MAIDIGRRNFLAALGGAAVARPLAVRAQDAGRTYRLGFLNPMVREGPGVVALFDELRRSGFIEGQNLLVVGGFGMRNDQIDSIAASVVAASPDAIVAGPELPLRALQKFDSYHPAYRNGRGHGRRRICGFIGSAGRQHYGIEASSLLSSTANAKKF